MKSLLCNISVKPILEFVVKNKVSASIFTNDFFKNLYNVLKESNDANNMNEDIINIDNITINIDYIRGLNGLLFNSIYNLIKSFLLTAEKYFNKDKTYFIKISSFHDLYMFIKIFNKKEEICRFRVDKSSDKHNWEYIKKPLSGQSEYLSIEEGLKLL